MTDQPSHVLTSHIALSPEILELTERLAEHVHDAWVRQRVSEGWTWGTARDDTTQRHPCLVPYGELSEIEKQYDRNAALETLKFIQALGYQIVPHREGTASGLSAATNPSEIRNRIQSLLERLRAAETSSQELAVMMQVWSQRSSDDPLWHSSLELHQHLARRFLKLGAAPQAKEVARTALEMIVRGPDGQERSPWSDDVPLRQCLGLALARTGNPGDAQKVLRPLHEAGQADEESLGILARTYKDQSAQLPVGHARRQELLRTSLSLYREAYEQSHGFWTGINVATLLRLLNETDDARRVAGHVRDQCLASLEAERKQGIAPDKTYWHWATLGEAELILGDFERAGDYYRQARAVAPRNFGDLNSTRRHAGWLLEHAIATGELTADSKALLDDWLPLPLVVVFAGHMIDRAERPTPRFPKQLVEPVRRTLRDWLSAGQGLIGYSSAACGADLLFQQVVQELGGESRIVLPYDRDEFRVDSVDFAGPEWSQLFDQVLDRATQIVTTSPQKMIAGESTYDFANLVLHGMAMVRQAELHTRLAGLVVWDHQPGDGPGGTASVVRRWRDLGLCVDSISLAPAALATSPLSAPLDEETDEAQVTRPAALRLPVVHNPDPPLPVRGGPIEESNERRLMSMLFGDAVSYGKLTEQQVPLFVRHFLGPIADIVQNYESGNVVRNTWGDGLYLVFTTVREAGLCALDICDFVRDQVDGGKWSSRGLPQDLNIRLALHSGPVFGCIDPITRQINFTGTHVSRAARLEPRTPPGEVYASEAFAALCAESKVSELSCMYVKQLEWAKHYGTFPTFVLRRRTTDDHSELAQK